LILEVLLGRIPLSEIVQASQEVEHQTIARETVTPEIKKEPRVLFFDLETRNLAKDVGGWQNTHLMRVSVGVVYDRSEDRFFVYEEEDVDNLLARFKEADLIVGFNVKRFDYKVLSAYTSMDLNALPTFDILDDIHARLGYRLSLDHLARETLDTGKTASGLEAVEWFRNGEMKKLIEYCTHDVVVTRDLFDFGLEKGRLLYREKKSQKKVRLLVDWKLSELIPGS
jgi:DEAD/DEAH box helicase domain-containing protein